MLPSERELEFTDKIIEGWCVGADIRVNCSVPTPKKKIKSNLKL